MSKHGILDSGISYIGGGGLAAGGAFVEPVCEIMVYIQNTAIILGCALVFVKLIHDGLKLYWAWKDRKDK